MTEAVPFVQSIFPQPVKAVKRAKPLRMTEAVLYKASFRSLLKPSSAQTLYGTTEAVPFVQSIFPQPVKAVKRANPLWHDEAVPFVQSIFPQPVKAVKRANHLWHG